MEAAGRCWICWDPRPTVKTVGGQGSTPGPNSNKKGGATRKERGRPHRCCPGWGAAAATKTRREAATEGFCAVVGVALLSRPRVAQET